jgi:hypothetical protein
MSGLKLKSVPQFPGKVIGGAGIDVEKTNGNWTISLDYDDYPLVSPFTPGPQHYVLLWDSILNNYFLVPATTLTA